MNVLGLLSRLAAESRAWFFQERSLVNYGVLDSVHSGSVRMTLVLRRKDNSKTDGRHRARSASSTQPQRCGQSPPTRGQFLSENEIVTSCVRKGRGCFAEMRAATNGRRCKQGNHTIFVITWTERCRRPAEFATVDRSARQRATLREVSGGAFARELKWQHSAALHMRSTGRAATPEIESISGGSVGRMSAGCRM